jgi:hypothetical protein
MLNHDNKESLGFVLVVLIAGMLACNLPSGQPVDNPVMQNEQSQSGLTMPPSGDLLNEKSDDDVPLNTSLDQVDSGLSRLNPYPIDTEVNTPYWDFKVLEFQRGEQAWQIIQADDPNNPPPPPGQEYVLIKLWLRNKNPTPNAQNIGLNEIFVTGDSGRVHSDKLVDRPAPEVVFSDIFTAEILEGWLDVLVDSTDQNLMLVFDREDFVNQEIQARQVRYVALSEGASLAVPPDLEEIPINDLGLEPDNPAKIGQTVIGEDWEVTILEAVSGDAAMDIVLQMNDKSDPPDEGMEYIAFRARLRRISTQDMRDYRPNFWTYRVIDQSGNWETIAEPRINNKHPELFAKTDFYFFPGLESEGWFVLTGPAGQTPQLATIDVGGDYAVARRYLQLVP